MPEPYEWAVLRVVPRVERGEYVNVGVVVYSHARDFLCARVALRADRVMSLDPEVDIDLVDRHLQALVALCAGDPAGTASERRTPGERFRWMVAPRSTVVQSSEVHTGLAEDPADEVDRLMRALGLAGT